MNNRQVWLLLFLGAHSGPYPIDQVRAMKGMFLIDRTLFPPRGALYRWFAFDYGPFSSLVYRDLDSLQTAEFVDVTYALGSSRRIYTLSERGRRMFAEKAAHTSAATMQEIQTIKTHVTSTGYEELLREILDAYPEFAMHSNLRATGD